MRTLRRQSDLRDALRRRGAATFDYILTLAALFTISALVVRLGSRIIRLAYDMVNVFISWPFL